MEAESFNVSLLFGLSRNVTLPGFALSWIRDDTQLSPHPQMCNSKMWPPPLIFSELLFFNHSILSYYLKCNILRRSTSVFDYFDLLIGCLNFQDHIKNVNLDQALEKKKSKLKTKLWISGCTT